MRIWTQRFKVATVLEATARILYMIEATGGKPAGISPENVAVMKDFCQKSLWSGEIAGYKRESEHKRQQCIALLPFVLPWI